MPDPENDAKSAVQKILYSWACWQRIWCLLESNKQKSKSNVWLGGAWHQHADLKWHRSMWADSKVL